MFKKIVCAHALGLPLFACAAVPLSMDCTSTVRDFFAPLVQGDLIARKPYIVDQHSLNHFKPKLFKPLTVYGLPVIYVLGYANDPLLFINKGSPPDADVYGVIVKEGIANVQAQLTSVGAVQARTYRVDAQLTAIICKGVSE
ncbi:hypothetical protein [Duganella sp. BuS-21]|uniref:hypothetical protein n=1 Tax=Duganella sp. BuS-21 TaxID=2943848 RepID=UPI0035A654AF